MCTAYRPTFCADIGENPMMFCARFSVLYYIRCQSSSYDLYDDLWMLTITFVGAGTVFMRQNLPQ